MTLLQKVRRGKIKKPHLLLIYGVDGVGKSTFGAEAPDPIFLGSEEGTNNLDVNRFPTPSSWADVCAALNELASEEHSYKTLVVDSLDWLEPILHQEICNRHGSKTIELAAGGYGKGYVEAVNEWIKFCSLLTKIREQKGMNVILIAHSDVVRFSDPNLQSEYDRYQLKLYKKTAAKVREFVDCVLFANYEIFQKKDGSKTRHFGNGVRFLYTEHRPGFDAKNRFGLPFQIPLSYSDYAQAASQINDAEPENIKKIIAGMLEEVTDDDLRKKVMGACEIAGKDIVRLEAIKSKLSIRIGEQS